MRAFVRVWVRESISPSGNHDVVREKKGLLVNTGHGVSSLERKKQSKRVAYSRPPFSPYPPCSLTIHANALNNRSFFSSSSSSPSSFSVSFSPSRTSCGFLIFSCVFFLLTFFSLLYPPLLFLSFLRFLPALVPTILGSTLLGDEKKSLVFFADLLLSRMLMSIFDVLFYSFFFFFLLFCRSDR